MDGVQDEQGITADWEIRRELIDGVLVKEVRHVPKENGLLTEVFRRDWQLGDDTVDQVFQVTLFPGGISAWHTHKETIDRLFVNQGQIKIVLYDSRPGSPTEGRLNEFRLGSSRPALLVVPPNVWHGIQNLSPDSSSILNLVDVAYRYERPDHWRLPQDTPEIPYSFSA